MSIKDHRLHLLLVGLLILAAALLIPFLTQQKPPPFQPDGPVTDEPFKGAMGENIERDGIFHSLAVSPSNPDIVYVGTETNAIFKSLDGGSNWKWLRQGILHNQRAYPEVYDIIIHPNNEQLLYAALTNGPNTPEFEQAAGVYRSTDAGQSWERIINGLENVSIDSLTFDHSNPSLVYVGTNGEEPTNHLAEGMKIPGGLYRSTTQAEKWLPLDLPAKAQDSRFERIVANGNCIISNGLRFTGKDSKAGPRMPNPQTAIGLIKSTDGGNSWINITPNNTFAYYFDATPDCQTIYLTDDQGRAYISTDGGQTWKQSGVYAGGVIKISPFDKNTVFFASGNKLHKSTNGLQSANQVYEVSSGHNIEDIEFSSDPNIIYLAGDGYRVYRSDNAGASFTQIANLREFINNYPE